MKEKILKIALKILFPLEFVISFILVWLVYLTMTTKNYAGYWSRDLLLGLIPMAILLIAILILNYIKNKKQIEKIFLGFMIPIGLCYLVFMGPEYTPDENAHLWKSYEISQGQIITPIDEEGKSHTEVPKDFIRSYSNYNELNMLLTSQETDYQDTETLVNPAQNYNPVLYMFSSIGLIIGKALGMNGTLIQYVARMLNYIVFLICSYWAIKKIPFGKLLLSTYLFMPMVIHQAISISADSLINSVLLFYIAYNLFLFFKKEEMRTYEMVIYIVMSAFVGITKIVYFPLVGMSLFFIFKKDMKKSQKQIMIISSIVITMIVTCLWYAFSLKYTGHEEYLLEHNVNAKEQIKYVLTNPKQGIKVLLNTVTVRGEIYLYTMIGSNLGWLDIGVPMIKIIGFILLIVLSIFFEKNEVSLSVKQRLWLIGITFAIMVLILMALYVGWTGVGGEIIDGVQGRYFIPIMILPLLCCAMKDNYVKIKNIHVYMLLAISLLNVSVISNVYHFFI